MENKVCFKNNGKLKLLIIVGTRPEIIRLAAVIKKCRVYFDTILAHTGQNYDYNLNGVFFHDLELDDPEYYMNAVGKDLGETMGNIIAKSYELMVEIKPDAVLVLGDTNSCLSVIGAKRLHIPIFHMEAGNRCKDECLPEETNRRIVDIISDVNLAYSEHARRYLADCGLPKERTYVTGSPMAEVLHNNLEKIKASNVHEKLGLKKGKYILLSAHREENIDTEKNFLSLFNAINKMAEKYDMPILYSCHPRSKKRIESTGFKLDKRVLSRTLEDGGTMFSFLIPWDTAGIYTASVLGVATLTYAPYAFLLWINPIIAAIYALTGLFQFKDESADKDKKSEEKNEKEEA